MVVLVWFYALEPIFTSSLLPGKSSLLVSVIHTIASVPNLEYAYPQGYMWNLKRYAKKLMLLWRCHEITSIILLRGNWVLFFLFRGTQSEKGWKPLLYIIQNTLIVTWTERNWRIRRMFLSMSKSQNWIQNSERSRIRLSKWKIAQWRPSYCHETSRTILNCLFLNEKWRVRCVSMCVCEKAII